MQLPWSLSHIDLRAQSRGWLRWQEGKPRQLTCPACGETHPMPSRMDTASPAHRLRRFALRECPHCGSGHFPGLKPPAYEGKKAKSGERIREIAALKYYLEQGAGILSMVSPLMALAKRRGLSLLEVGCGYGLSLHFAREALGWQVQGCDPSSLARVGAEDLGLDISPEYLEPGSQLNGAPFDVIYSSEVIEHVSNPVAFLQTLKGLLKPDGMLILTTPNVGGIRNDRSLDSLLPLVSPGSHLVLFSETGLQQTLQRAGLEHAEVRADGDTLFAWAGTLDNLGFTQARDQQALYQDYLSAQAQHFIDMPGLYAGFAGRLIKELGNSGQHDKLGPVLTGLFARWRDDYGLDLSHPNDLKLPDPKKLQFEAYAKNVPLNLPVVLFYAGMHAWQGKNDMARARDLFLACCRTAGEMQDAFRQVNVIDLEIMLLSGMARVHAAEMVLAGNPEQAAAELADMQVAEQPEEVRAAWQRVSDALYAHAAHTGKWDIADPLHADIAARYRNYDTRDDHGRNVTSALASYALNKIQNRMQGLYWLDKALAQAPVDDASERLRTIFADQAYAEMADRLAMSGDLPDLQSELQQGLMSGAGNPERSAILRDLAVRLRQTDPVSSWRWMQRSMHAGMDRTELTQAHDQLEQDFISATAQGDKSTAEALHADAVELAQEQPHASPALLLALGLDALNRMADPCAAVAWLRAAGKSGAMDTRSQAEAALAIARQQIGDELIQASAAGRHARTGELAAALDVPPDNAEIHYALGMHALNHVGDMELAQDHFSTAAHLADDPDLRARAQFHDALVLVRSGKPAQARALADSLFNGADADTLPADIRSRETELRTRIGEGETTA